MEKRISHGGFFAAFEDVKRQEIQVSRTPTNREAYDITEEIYERANGERRFSSFESFQRSYYYRAKKRRS